jgi:23S rRNA (guanosine2251-2'-O)-methyltransferase
MNRKLRNDELDRISVEEFQKIKKLPIIVLLDNVRSMNNVGSIFRSCDAFLVEKLYLCGITPTPPHRDIRKTALGADESVSWEYSKSPLELIELLKKEGYKIIGIEQATKKTLLNHFKPSLDEKFVFVFGSEVGGVSQEVINCCDEIVEIPQEGTKHSLNISVSVGVVLWHYRNALFV